MCIVDDCDIDAQRLVAFIQQLLPDEQHSIDLFTSGELFLKRYATGAYQIIFLDYYMDGMTGMEVARAVRAAEDPCKIVFTTNSPDFALEGYEVSADGYLVKPYAYETFASTMKRVMPQDQLYLEICAGRTMKKVLLAHILWCEADAHRITIHTTERENLAVQMNYAQIHDQLSVYPQFLECYRGCMVNMDQIRRIDGLDFVLYSEERVPIRQREFGTIKQKFLNYLFEKARNS